MLVTGPGLFQMAREKTAKPVAQEKPPLAAAAAAHQGSLQHEAAPAPVEKQVLNNLALMRAFNARSLVRQQAQRVAVAMSPEGYKPR